MLFSRVKILQDRLFQCRIGELQRAVLGVGDIRYGVVTRPIQNGESVQVIPPVQIPW